MNETEVLVNVSLRFPDLDREALARHIAPIVMAAIAAGGRFTNVSIQPYEDDEE